MDTCRGCSSVCKELMFSPTLGPPFSTAIHHWPSEDHPPFLTVAEWSACAAAELADYLFMECAFPSGAILSTGGPALLFHCISQAIACPALPFFSCRTPWGSRSHLGATHCLSPHFSEKKL